VVSSPRVSTGPAGCRISRDYARRGWATKTSHPSWGPRDPSQVNDSNRQGRHQGIHDKMGMQRMRRARGEGAHRWRRGWEGEVGNGRGVFAWCLCYLWRE